METWIMPVRLHGKTAKLHSFWCSFYSFNKLLLMTMKIGPPSPHPFSLPGNKSDLSSHNPVEKKLKSDLGVTLQCEHIPV